MQKQRNTCKYCGKRCRGDYCFAHKPRKPIPKQGKQFKKWVDVRQSWIRKYGSDHLCYLCGIPLNTNTLTLDHVIPKSNAKNYSNRHSDSNLKPCCWTCNGQKGSKHLDLLK